jgi:hypothetical protein
VDTTIKDAIQVTVWAVAIAGGLIAAFKAVHEMRQTREMRAQELRWKKAQLAREVLNGFWAKAHFHDALLMLDWSGRQYKIDDKFERVFWEDLPGALRVWAEPIGFAPKETYIRDCFDALFDAMNTLEHYLRTGLLDFADVQFPMAYYAKLLTQRLSTLDLYLEHYDFKLASGFLNRYGVRATS